MDDRKRVLVVDDDEEVLFVWTSALRKLPELEVETAANGAEALERFESDSFDLVVTDLAMPVMDGVALTRAIRETDTIIPIVWITAYSQLHDNLEKRDLNIYSFLSKPVSIQEIRSIVRNALDYEQNNGNSINRSDQERG
ncbi:MAG TPA: response regulator [Anaerolineae bacterium]|nr:response regulator [Anaerolineae bacterium]